MKIRLLHLYENLLNLYGEYGNVRMLSAMLSAQGLSVETVRVETAAGLNFASYDFIYAGAGTEMNLLCALSDLKKNAGSFIAAVESKVPVLFTGNAWEMAGSGITDHGGVFHEGLSMFSFRSLHTGKRETSDVIFTSERIEEKTVGFINLGSRVEGLTDPLFHVLYGLGADSQNRCDGVYHENFLGMSVIGPVLVRNPHILNRIAYGICEHCGCIFKPELLDLDLAGNYQRVLQRLEKRMEMEKAKA